MAMYVDEFSQLYAQPERSGRNITLEEFEIPSAAILY